MLLSKKHIIALFLLIGLSGCQTISTSEITARTQDALNRIEVRDADTRFEQIFNRQLLDSLNQGPALRDLVLYTNLSATNSSTLAVKGQSSTLSKTQMTLLYELHDKISKEVITSGKIRVTATSGTVSSYYGQDKSKQFAAERLTKQLADKLVLRLRRFFLDG
ncbi:MAG: hypothetical protein ACON49_02810 [Candidatus Puniceispirillaceae bacterium]